MTTPDERRAETFLAAFNALCAASDRIVPMPAAGAVLVLASPYTYEVRFTVEGLPMRATFQRALLESLGPATMAGRIFDAAARAHNPTAVFTAEATLAPMGASPWIWSVIP